MTAAAKAASGRRKPPAPVLVEHRNEVSIVGRLSKPAELKVLPSGDEVAFWRLVVDRPPGVTRAGFDTIDCTAFTARVRRAALGWKPGATVEVTGSLRRRFWRGNGGLASACEVLVATAVRLDG
jgi:single-strand DNA-binding protein